MIKQQNTLLIKNLIEFGLSEKEAKVYIALLGLEIAPVQEIAKKAGTNRSSTYVVLNSLKKKGLVATSEDKDGGQYVVTAPEVLAQIAENLAERQERIKKNISNLIPELKALYKGTKKRPTVRVMEGVNGLIASFEETLNCKEKLMRVVSSVGRLSDVLPPTYLPEYVKRRHALGIKMRGIHPYDQTFKYLMRAGVDGFDSPIGIPEEKYAFPADIAIFDNKIGYMSPEDGGLSLLIESKEITDVMKLVFDLAWEEANRLKMNKSDKNLNASQKNRSA